MIGQRALVQASLAREHSAYDASGPRSPHPTVEDRLRAEVARLEVRLAMALDSRALLAEAFLGATGRSTALSKKQASQNADNEGKAA